MAGGKTRAESVLKGLQAVREATAEMVAVHDGVRPFVTPDEISRTVTAAGEQGAAILVSTPVGHDKRNRGRESRQNFEAGRSAQRADTAVFPL